MRMGGEDGHADAVAKPLGLKRSEICHSMAECGLFRLVSADSMSPTIYVAYSWHRKSCNVSMTVAIATAIHGISRFQCHKLEPSHNTGRVGSSPRMRGTHGLRSKKRQAIGIIPAHARNTDFYFRVQLQCRDHPRACGEHFLSRQKLPTVPGSSPRMRGTRFVPWQVRVGCGIIPAHAGNTRFHRP